MGTPHKRSVHVCALAAHLMRAHVRHAYVHSEGATSKGLCARPLPYACAHASRISQLRESDARTRVRCLTDGAACGRAPCIRRLQGRDARACVLAPLIRCLRTCATHG
eukprot:6184335-Pleurochrysis_carterae.AAC.4